MFEKKIYLPLNGRANTTFNINWKTIVPKSKNGYTFRIRYVSDRNSVIDAINTSMIIRTTLLNGCLNNNLYTDKFYQQTSTVAYMGQLTLSTYEDIPNINAGDFKSMISIDRDYHINCLPNNNFTVYYQSISQGQINDVLVIGAYIPAGMLIVQINGE